MAEPLPPQPASDFLTPPACTRCGGPNNRGRRTRLCALCAGQSAVAQAKEKAAERRAAAPEGQRWCSSCDEYVAAEAFAKSAHVCRTCSATQQRVRHLQRAFGITPAEYDQILASQDGRCAICKNKPKKKRLHVDHDHKTGQVRGLLCLWCNHRLLGGARESVDVLMAAVSYLTEPPALAVVGERIAPSKPRVTSKPKAKKKRSTT